MKKTKTAVKVVGNVVISSSVGYVIGQAIGIIMPPQVKTAQKVMSMVGGCIISQYMTSKIITDFDAAVDDIFDVEKEENLEEPETV